MCGGADLFLGLLAVLFPPVAVWVKRGICSADSFINIALCMLGYLPGLLHAWYIISSYPDRSYDPSEHPEDGTVRYYYVQAGSRSHPHGQRVPVNAQPAAGYGTLPAGQFPGQQQSGVVNQHSAKGVPQPKNTGKLAKAAPRQQQQPQQQAGSSSSAAAAAPRQQQEDGGEGSTVPPPSYADAVKGDHKVQDQD